MPRIVVMLLVISLCLLSVYLWLYKREVTRMREQLTFIRENDTNDTLTLELQTKELKELANELNHLITHFNEERIGLSREQRAFKEELTNISHDLRTPLTSIAGYVQMLDSGELSEEKRTEYYRIISGRLDAAVKLLDDFFQFTRLESEAVVLEKETVNVNNVLMETLTLYYQDFLDKGSEPAIHLPSQPLFITADQEALERIIQNLIQNYLRHGHGNFSVSLESKELFVRIRFKNQATDVEAAEVERLFERFYTADRSRSQKTTGLGLAIVQHLVTKMAGDIEASVENGYLTIVLHFPESKT